MGSGISTRYRFPSPGVHQKTQQRGNCKPGTRRNPVRKKAAGSSFLSLFGGSHGGLFLRQKNRKGERLFQNGIPILPSEPVQIAGYEGRVYSSATARGKSSGAPCPFMNLFQGRFGSSGIFSCIRTKAQKIFE